MNEYSAPTLAPGIGTKHDEVYIKHPNIIEYYDYNDNEMTNSIFITMELLTNIKTYFQDKILF